MLIVKKQILPKQLQQKVLTPIRSSADLTKSRTVNQANIKIYHFKKTKDSSEYQSQEEILERSSQTTNKLARESAESGGGEVVLQNQDINTYL